MLRNAAQHALEALHSVEWHGGSSARMLDDCKVENAIHALRAALAEDALQRLTDVSQEIEAALAEPQCNPHPKAPHGILRNLSHNEHSYVCKCEGWEPYEAGYQAGMEAALRGQI